MTAYKFHADTIIQFKIFQYIKECFELEAVRLVKQGNGGIIVIDAKKNAMAFTLEDGEVIGSDMTFC